MADESKSTAPERERSPWFQAGQVVFLLAMLVGVYMLAHSMVEHRFFQGGHQDKHGVLRF
jgi:hypothetical protein